MRPIRALPGWRSPCVTPPTLEGRAPGSYLAASLADPDSGDPEPLAAIEDLYRNATAPIVFRPRVQLQTFFAGFDLVEPGLVEIPDWCPTSAEQSRAERAGTPWVSLAAVGRKP